LFLNVLYNKHIIIKKNVLKLLKHLKDGNVECSTTTFGINIVLIFDNDNNALILDSIHTPVITDYFWVLDLKLKDFTLAPLMVLEEITGQAIEVKIADFSFVLPTKWNILVVDEDTSILDVVEVADVAGSEFQAFVYGQTMSRSVAATISVCNFLPNHHTVGPSLNKHQMLCHPISPTSWVCISPSDSYNKYLKNQLVGDVV